MSGYESIRDWAFDNYDFNDYDNFQSWLDAIESDFDLNGRGIPLRKIFDNQDFIDLENEFEERKGIIFDPPPPPPPPEPPKKKGIVEKAISKILGFFGL